MDSFARIERKVARKKDATLERCIRIPCSDAGLICPSATLRANVSRLATTSSAGGGAIVKILFWYPESAPRALDSKKVLGLRATKTRTFRVAASSAPGLGQLVTAAFL